MRIVINADDFGASRDVNDAIVECLEGGLVSSASIMVDAPETDEAVEYARAHPEYSYGVHLQFVGDGHEQPVSPPERVPALVDRDGRLLATNIVRRRAMLGQIPPAQIEREISAQVAFVRRHGVAATHVDSHRHIHKFPPFTRALCNVSSDLSVVSVRNVQDTFLRRPLEHPTYWWGRLWRHSLMSAFSTTDHFYMPTTAHDTNWNQLAEHLPQSAETLEVGLHPGRSEDWRREEMRSLEAFVSAIERYGHQLVGWDSL